MTKKVLDLLRDLTPFQMTTSLSNLLYLCLSFLLFMLDIVTATDEHFRRVNGKILQCMTELAKSSGSFKGGSLGNLQQGVG